MKNNRIIIALIVACLLLIIIIATRTYHAPTPVVENLPTATSTKAGPDRLYPRADLTPGDTFPVIKDDVCTPGYATRVRNVPLSVKKQVYAEYGTAYPQPSGSYEVDHFISLELGGSNDIKNLWMEPAEPRPGFHEKDKVENYLHDEVCSGALTLEQAQQEIRTDWYAVYLSMPQH